MPRECFTLPKYVLKSYCDAGNSRPPGRDEDIARTVPDRKRGVPEGVNAQVAEFSRTCEAQAVRGNPVAGYEGPRRVEGVAIEVFRER
jgi:hypothetical protein